MNALTVHTVATLFLKLSYLAAGVLLCYLGRDLLLKGVTAQFEGEGESSRVKLRILTSSPGLVFLLAGLIVVVSAVFSTTQFKETEETIRATSSEANDGDRSRNPTRSESTPETKTVLPTLRDLAQSIRQRSSRLASGEEISGDMQFALLQIEKATAEARSGNGRLASAYLAAAIVVSPELLPTVLDSADLAKATRDPDFELIVRTRFKLPLAHSEVRKGDSIYRREAATLGALRLYSILYKASGRPLLEVKDLLEHVPKQPGTEVPEKTLQTLDQLLSRDPDQLLAFLQSSKGGWILRDQSVGAQLHERMYERLKELQRRDVSSDNEPK